jgi:predicted ATPase
VGDILPANGQSPEVRFVVEQSDDRVEWRLMARAGERSLQVVDVSLKSSNAGTAKVPPEQRAPTLAVGSALLPELVFISAVREGQAETYPVPDMEVSLPGDVGIDGRFAAHWYERFADDPVPEERRFPGEEATSLRKQLDAWLSSLFPGAQANAQLLPNISLVSLQFRNSGTGEWRRPANVGYGLTYAFPILVALLTAADGRLIVIDSPEAHLHPFAQSQMGRMLAHFANAGVSVLVETHSDHLLNGVRLAVKEAVVGSTDVSVYFFTGASPDSHGVVSPVIDTQGRVDQWPGGFFDQAERDLGRLAGWDP